MPYMFNLNSSKLAEVQSTSCSCEHDYFEHYNLTLRLVLEYFKVTIIL